MFELQSDSNGTVRLTGRLDAAAAEDAVGDFRGLSGPLTVDCATLEYISSAGLGLLIETYKRLRGQGHGLRLVNLSPNVRNVFVYAGLDQLLQIE